MRDGTSKIIFNYFKIGRHLDWRDLRQEAALAAIVAQETWREDLGPLIPYRNRAIALRLREYVARSRCPLSGGVHVVKHLWSLQPAPLAEARRLPAPVRPIEALIDARRAEEVARRVLELVSDGDLAAEVILRERAPREVAATLRLPVERVYRAAKRAKKALRASDRLRELVGA